MKDVLILNDFVSRGKIAGNIVDVILSYYQFNTYFIPTSLISNNFALGKVASLNTNTYIKDCLKTYSDLGFIFDLIFIGFIEDAYQKDIIIEFLNDISYRPTIVLDPIMADDGKLYKSLDESKIELYKEIASHADIVIPNKTEADFLNITDYKNLSKGDKKYIITSLSKNDSHLNLEINKSLKQHEFENVDNKAFGTGDLFDGIFIGEYLKTDDFTHAVEFASKKITEILSLQNKEYPKSSNILIERYLHVLDQGGSHA